MRILAQSTNTRGFVRLWGYAIQVAGQISAPATLINMMMLALTFSRVWGIPWYWVVGIAFSAVGILGVIAWKFALPGVFAAQNEQWYKHDNPMRQDIERIAELVESQIKEGRKGRPHD